MRPGPLILSSISLFFVSEALAQAPLRHWMEGVDLRYSVSQPVLHYTLRVDSTDLSGWSVELRIRNAPDTIRLGMVVHPEYDDRFWRFVEGFDANGPKGAAVTRLDSTLWRVVAPGGETVVRYRIHLPPPESSNREGWVPFLAPTGGLVGGLHGFMYLVGYSLAPAHVTLDPPGSWVVATGLTQTTDPHTWFAANAFVLSDSPMLVGRLRRWGYVEDGVPHQVAYWPGPKAAPFDTAALVDGLARLTHQAVQLFGRAPYRDFTFQVQDLAAGSLEHSNSVSIGAPSEELKKGLNGFFSEAAHEYTHTWNLMRLHPAEYDDVDYRTPRRSRGLWWSEGITLYYADLMLRRAGLPTSDSTRLQHLERLITRYVAYPGYTRFSPESVSAVAYGFRPGVLGDHTPSVHLQGELIGTLIDLEVRYLTSGRRSLADVTRLLLARFSGTRGFVTADVERAMAEVCGCPAAAHQLFERYVRHPLPIDFKHYLGRAGLQARIRWEPAVDDSGHAVPDNRVFGLDNPEGPSLLLNTPEGAWGKAGLHTGDRVRSINGVRTDSASQIRQIRNRLRIGDTVRVELAGRAGGRTVTFVITGYQRPVVKIEELPEITERQRKVRDSWLGGEL